jgi:hypothetical protein
MDTGVYISLGAVLISFVGLVLNSRKTTRDDAAASARLDTQLANIATGVEDIRVEMRSTRDRINGISERLSAVESSCKSAHHRLDQMEAQR